MACYIDVPQCVDSPHNCQYLGSSTNDGEDGALQLEGGRGRWSRPLYMTWTHREGGVEGGSDRPKVEESEGQSFTRHEVLHMLPGPPQKREAETMVTRSSHGRGDVQCVTFQG